MDHHLTRLEHDARRPRLAMEADGPANTNTRERTEGAATAVQAMHCDSFSACRVDLGPKSNSTSFGMMAKPRALPCRDDVVVESGDTAPNSYLPYFAHNNSRRWLTSHRQNLPSTGDHLQRTTSSGLLDRGGEL